MEPIGDGRPQNSLHPSGRRKSKPRKGGASAAFAAGASCVASSDRFSALLARRRPRRRVDRTSLQGSHAIVDLDRDFYRLDDRGNDPVAVGRRFFLLFVGLAQRRRRFCRAVGRLQPIQVMAACWKRIARFMNRERRPLHFNRTLAVHDRSGAATKTGKRPRRGCGRNV